MKHLFEAEIFVDTVFSIESGAGNGNRFYLADYATMHEFLTDCVSWFSDATAPEWVYVEWYGIPDSMINRTWICPNIFEIRDALQMLDEDSIGRFPLWCRDNGHDLTKDDPSILVTRYQDYIRPVYEPDPDTSGPEVCNCAIVPYTLAELGIGPVDIFDDNYND